MSKVLGLKEQKWSEEKEWRKVIEFKDGVEVLRHNGKPYTKYYLDKSHLTGVTVFCSSNTFDKARRDADEINHYISERGYSADVRVEIYE